MLKEFFASKIICTLGVLAVTASVKSQNLEMSKNWLKEDRKLQLKTNIVLESEYIKLPTTDTFYSNQKILYKEEDDNYSVDYLNSSIKEELKYMPVSPPSGINLSDPKAWFTAAKLKKRYRKMKQITSYVYPIE